MSVLKSLESKIAGLVEGTFSRVFRSEVRPVEIARKLAREMEEHRSHSLSATYVPNEYRIYLSPRDRERFRDYEEALAAELAGYVLEHARREDFALVARPVIAFETDRRLGLGEFGIEARVTQGEPEPPPPVAAPAAGAPAGHTMVFSDAGRYTEPLRETGRAERMRAVLLYNGRRLRVGPEGATIGRSRDCEIVVEDPNVSRRHAELRPSGASWVLTDLGSTNGTLLNGRRLAGGEVLGSGDEIEVGASVIAFEVE